MTHRRSTFLAVSAIVAGVAAPPAGAQDARTLGAVLHAVTTRADVALVVAPEIDQDRVAADVRGLPMDRAVRELLKNYDAFFFYGGTTPSPTELRGVWVYPKGTAALLRPVPPEAWAANRELTALLPTADARTREQIYESLMSRPDPASRETVLQALRGATEPDTELRERLLSSAISRGLPFPPQLLRDIAAADRSDTIRLMALDALAFEDDASQVAQGALADPSDAVRERAAEILEQVQGGAR